MLNLSQSNRAARKVLTSAALMAALVCGSGATLVATVATSPALAQVADLTGSEDKAKIDKLQHDIDPKHYPAPPKVDPKPDPAPEPGLVQRCINWVCSLFSDDEEQDKKEHDAALKKAIEERHQAEEAQKRLELQKTAHAPKTETLKTETLKTQSLKTEAKGLETRGNAIKAVETPKQSTAKFELAHPASLKATALNVESTKLAAAPKSLAAAPKSLAATSLARPLAASSLTVTTRLSGFSVVKR